MREILFVCSGNTCRSPMAEGIARALIDGSMPPGVTVASAGSSASDGSPASANAVEVAGAAGIDISRHRSRLLNTAMVRRASLIVTMGERHRHTVGEIDPDALEYTVMLSEFGEGCDGDIADPYGGDLHRYQQTFEMIRECVEGLVDRVRSGEIDAWRRDEGSV